MSPRPPESTLFPYTTLFRSLVNIHSIHGKNVTVDNGIVPWGARSVIAKIIAIHIAIMGEKVGKPIQPLARAIQCEWPGLAPRGDPVGISTLRDLAGIGCQIN